MTGAIGAHRAQTEGRPRISRRRTSRRLGYFTPSWAFACFHEMGVSPFASTFSISRLAMPLQDEPLVSKGHFIQNFDRSRAFIHRRRNSAVAWPSGLHERFSLLFAGSGEGGNHRGMEDDLVSDNRTSVAKLRSTRGHHVLRGGKARLPSRGYGSVPPFQLAAIGAG